MHAVCSYCTDISRGTVNKTLNFFFPQFVLSYSYHITWTFCHSEEGSSFLRNVCQTTIVTIHKTVSPVFSFTAFWANVVDKIRFYVPLVE